MESPEDEIMKNLKKLNLAIESYANERMADKGLTSAQGHVLMYILEHRDICSTHIHNELGISRGTVSGLLKKLRDKGYIQLSRCVKDDRQKIIQVTDKARVLKEALDECRETLETQVFCGLTHQEKQTLLDLQRRMLRNMGRAAQP